MGGTEPGSMQVAVMKLHMPMVSRKEKGRLDRTVNTGDRGRRCWVRKMPYITYNPT